MLLFNIGLWRATLFSNYVNKQQLKLNNQHAIYTMQSILLGVDRLHSTKWTLGSFIFIVDYNNFRTDIAFRFVCLGAFAFLYIVCTLIHRYHSIDRKRKEEWILNWATSLNRPSSNTFRSGWHSSPDMNNPWTFTLFCHVKTWFKWLAHDIVLTESVHICKRVWLNGRYNSWAATAFCYGDTKRAWFCYYKTMEWVRPIQCEIGWNRSGFEWPLHFEQ